MKRATKLKIAAALGTLVAISACSLVVDTNKDQCSTDSDCHTAGAVCSDGVCALTKGDGGPDTDGTPGDASLDCTPKVPVSQSDFLNETCTSAQCIDFDNCARIGICDGATLPALVTPPAGGVNQ